MWMIYSRKWTTYSMTSPLPPNNSTLDPSTRLRRGARRPSVSPSTWGTTSIASWAERSVNSLDA